MSSTYLVALADLASGLSEPECEQSPFASQNHSVGQSSPSTGQTCLATTTYEHSPQTDWLATELVSMSFAGGFPCQDISTAGKGAGLAGQRSKLWWEFHRIIQEIRPRYAIIENVSALRHRGLDAVLGSLAAVGYDAEWHCIPAAAIGAPHRRDRLWIVAYPRCESAQVPPEGRFSAIQIPQRHPWWEVEPNVGRVADGVPVRMDRLKALGNAVVPQIPQIFGEIMLRFSRGVAR